MHTIEIQDWFDAKEWTIKINPLFVAVQQRPA